MNVRLVYRVLAAAASTLGLISIGALGTMLFVREVRPLLASAAGLSMIFMLALAIVLETMEHDRPWLKPEKRGR